MTPAHSRRAAGWLRSDPVRARCALPQDGVKRLAGLAACREVLTPAERRAAVAELDTLAAAPGAADPVLLVEALAALDEPASPGTLAYLRALVEQLGAARGAAATHPRLLRLRSGCARLGAGAAPTAAEWLESDMPAAGDVLVGDAALVSRACDRVSGLLEAGTSAGEELLGVLEAIAVSECRRYNLVLATTVLRVLRLARRDSRPVRSVEAFVLRQASRHGYFGHRTPFDPAPREDDLGAFHLPVTVALLCAFDTAPRKALVPSC